MRLKGERPVLLLESERLGACRALPEPYCVHPVPGWDALVALLPSTDAKTAVVVDPYGAGRKPSPRFWEALERFPSVTFVAALEVAPGVVPDARRMLQAGVSDLLDLRLAPGPERVGLLLRGVYARPLKRRVEAALSRFVSADALFLLRAAAEVAVSGGGALELARVCGVSAETVKEWCAGTGLPSPRRLQLWMRVLLAAQLLEDAGRTVGNAALACGYAGDRSLRRVMNQLIGVDTRSLRREAAFATVARAFNAELRHLREAACAPAPERAPKIQRKA